MKINQAVEVKSTVKVVYPVEVVQLLLRGELMKINRGVEVAELFSC